MLYAQAAFEAGAAIYNNINNNIEIEMKSKLEEYGQNKHRLNSKAFDVVDVGRDGRLQEADVLEVMSLYSGKWSQFHTALGLDVKSDDFVEMSPGFAEGTVSTGGGRRWW